VADATLDALRARARRAVTIRWESAARVEQAEVPQFLEVHQRMDREWHATLTGSAMELVRWSAGKPIEDLSIGQPDLSTLFQQYYG